jgi:hypothetical protein
VVAAVGCIAIRHDSQVQGDTITGSRTRPRPIAAGQFIQMVAEKPT